MLGLQVPRWFWNNMITVFNRIKANQNKTRCGGGGIALLGNEEKENVYILSRDLCPGCQLHSFTSFLMSSDSNGPKLSSPSPDWPPFPTLSVKAHFQAAEQGLRGRCIFIFFILNPSPTLQAAIRLRMSLSLTFLSRDFKVIVHRNEQN